MNSNFLEKRNISEIWSYFLSKKREPQYLKFGIPEIDESLKGGLLLGKLVEIYGSSGSGKTQIALSLTSEVLIQNLINSTQFVVLYLYTNGNFPIQRIHEILESKYYDLKRVAKGAPPVKISDLMKNLFIYKVIDREELHFILTSQLEKMLDYDVKLIVIDSIASLFRMVPNEGPSDMQNLSLIKIATILKRIADQYDLLVLAVNQATSGNTSGVPFINPRSSVKPALGDVWKRCVNSRILVSRKRETGFSAEIRHLQVIFSPNCPTTYPIPFITTKRGIEYNVLWNVGKQ